MEDATEGAETAEEDLFEVVSFRAEGSGFGEGLKGSSTVNMSIHVNGSRKGARPIIEDDNTLAGAAFKVFRVALSPFFPEMKDIHLVCYDKGMKYQNGAHEWPIEVVFNGCLEVIVFAMEKALKRAILDLRRK